MDDRVIRCTECGKWCERTLLFQHYGFRLRVPCACGTMLATGLSREDLPRVHVDFEASSPEQLRAGVPVHSTSELHEGVAIDADTPLWALY